MITQVLLKLQRIQYNTPKQSTLMSCITLIREHVENGIVELHFVPTDKQLADILTKALDETTFTRLVSELGMLNL